MASNSSLNGLSIKSTKTIQFRRRHRWMVFINRNSTFGNIQLVSCPAALWDLQHLFPADPMLRAITQSQKGWPTQEGKRQISHPSFKLKRPKRELTMLAQSTGSGFLRSTKSLAQPASLSSQRDKTTRCWVANLITSRNKARRLWMQKGISSLKIIWTISESRWRRTQGFLKLKARRLWMKCNRHLRCRWVWTTQSTQSGVPLIPWKNNNF